MLDFFKGTVTAKDWAFVGAVLGITGLLCAGFYFGVYKSQQAKLVTAQETLAETVSELKEARTIRAKFDEFKQEADKATKLVEMFEDRLPEEREIPRLRFDGYRLAETLSHEGRYRRGADVRADIEERPACVERLAVPVGAEGLHRGRELLRIALQRSHPSSHRVREGEAG